MRRGRHARRKSIYSHYRALRNRRIKKCGAEPAARPAKKRGAHTLEIGTKQPIWIRNGDRRAGGSLTTNGPAQQETVRNGDRQTVVHCPCLVPCREQPASPRLQVPARGKTTLHVWVAGKSAATTMVAPGGQTLFGHVSSGIEDTIRFR